MLSEEHSSALSMELFLWIVSFVFCNMLFRSKFPLLAFCMYVRFKWKIEILKVTQCKIWWIKWKSCDKNINKRKTSPAGVEQAKEKNGSCLKLLTEHCVTFLLPSFFLISPRCRSVSLLNRWWLFLIRFKSHFTLKMSCKMMASSWREGVPIKNWNRTQLEKNLLFWVV